MKKILTPIILFALFSLPALVNAQCVGGTVSAIRDTICQGTPGNLSLSGSTGTVQWQSSIDEVNFTNINGATNLTYKTVPLQQTIWVRAVLDGGSCVSDSIKLYVPPALTSYFNATLNGSAVVIFNADSSIGNIRSYHWDFGDGQTSTAKNPVHTYQFDTTYYICLTLYDISNCSYTFCRYVDDNGKGELYLTENHTNPTCGNSDGAINLSVSGGTGPYRFLWNTNDTTQNLSGVPAGTYNVAAVDANSLTGYLSVTLFNNNGPSITYSQTNYDVIDSIGGSLMVNVNGGTSPYTFSWSNGATDDSLSNLSPGTYTVTVTDAGGCAALQSFTIYSEYNNNYFVYVSGVEPNCHNNGTLSAIVYGGSPQYSYAWSNGGTDQTIAGLGAGDYTVTVTDAYSRKGIGYYTLESNCYSVIKGRIFSDANHNCIFDTGDSPVSWGYVSASNGSNTYYGYSNYDGTYTVYVQSTGAFQLTADFNYFGDACGNVTLCGNSSNTITIGTLGDTAIVNLGFVGASGYDLTIHPGWTSAKPGFEKEYWVMPYNQSINNSFTGSATIVFKYDTALIYKYSLNPQPVNDPVAHTLTWTVNNVPSPIYDWYNVRFENFFTVPANLPIGYQLQSDFYITPKSGDCDSSNNHLHFSEDVTGSHDPNEKEVSPAGDIRPEDSVLTYTIRFQNDGNDTTDFVIVRDTLSQYLNAASAQTIASSHPYQEFYISGKGILNWVFNPIYLVDSATNVAASKGFVSFRIKKKPNLPLNTVIPNKASIFFDYNGAVITNTVTNTITTGIRTVKGKSNVSVNVYPNPFSETSTFEVTGIQGSYSFTLSNVLGEKIQELTSINSGRFEINRNNLIAGIYFYSIVANGKTVANGKVVVQ